MSPDDFVFAIDDTDNPRYGKTSHASGNWVAKHAGYFGQKILLLVFVDIRKKIAIPLSYSFLVNRGHQERESVLKKAVNLVDECLEKGFPKLPVVADSWFDSVELMDDFMSRGMTYITEIKARRVARNGTGQWVSIH